MARAGRVPLIIATKPIEMYVNKMSGLLSAGAALNFFKSFGVITLAIDY